MSMNVKFFQMLEFINNRLANIEKNIAKLDEKLEFSIHLQRNHLIRIKNGHDIDDSVILFGKPYNDITPHRAFEIYNDNNMDFFILDVTNINFDSAKRLKSAIHIPLEDLRSRVAEIQSKTTPILIISERGLRSIQACELMVQKGFFNINNISGGYEFWPSLNKSQKATSKPLSS